MRVTAGAPQAWSEQRLDDPVGAPGGAELLQEVERLPVGAGLQPGQRLLPEGRLGLRQRPPGAPAGPPPGARPSRRAPAAPPRPPPRRPRSRPPASRAGEASSAGVTGPRRQHRRSRRGAAHRSSSSFTCAWTASAALAGASQRQARHVRLGVVVGQVREEHRHAPGPRRAPPGTRAPGRAPAPARPPPGSTSARASAGQRGQVDREVGQAGVGQAPGRGLQAASSDAGSAARHAPPRRPGRSARAAASLVGRLDHRPEPGLRRRRRPAGPARARCCSLLGRHQGRADHPRRRRPHQRAASGAAAAAARSRSLDESGQAALRGPSRSTTRAGRKARTGETRPTIPRGRDPVAGRSDPRTRAWTWA